MVASSFKNVPPSNLQMHKEVIVRDVSDIAPSRVFRSRGNTGARSVPSAHTADFRAVMLRDVGKKRVHVSCNFRQVSTSCVSKWTFHDLS